MGKSLLAAALGALAMFIWGFVSWTVLDFHGIESFEESRTIAEVMKASEPGEGVYWIPAMPKTDDRESDEYKEFEKRHGEGPRAMVVYHPSGAEVMEPLVLVKGYLVMFAACLLVVVLLQRAGFRNYFGRLLFCASFGIFAAVYADGSNWAWFNFPMKWTMEMAFDHLVAWAAAGIVIAAMVKPASN